MNTNTIAILHEARAPNKKRINKLARAVISNNLIRHGFSQSEIAQFLGLKQSTICRIISNSYDYDMETRYKLLDSEIHTDIPSLVTEIHDYLLS